MAYKPTEQLITAYDLNERMNEDIGWEGTNGKGIILYAGAKVEQAAYAHYAD